MPLHDEDKVEVTITVKLAPELIREYLRGDGERQEDIIYELVYDSMSRSLDSIIKRVADFDS
jgi:hypothetical protein